ncbi:MAG: PQQ-dependent sugar dehydrogenase [Polyangiales bacterium]
MDRRAMKIRAASLFLLLLAACSSDRPPPVIPPGVLQVEFEQVPFDTTLDYVTDFAFLPGDSGEFLAIGLYGKLELARLDQDGAASLLSGRFDDVYTEFDAGQLGLAIDPDFDSNRFFYIATNIAKNHVQLRRYTLGSTFSEIEASEVLILDLRVRSSAPRWHNISSLGFEEDGVMWVLVGDKGLFEPAQDPSDILGALIRILPSKEEGVGGYTIPEGAPRYSGDADPAVFAIGIRSPWKGRYHEGRWFFGDVGLDLFEEVNVISTVGENFGWPDVEGLCSEDARDTAPDCALYDDPPISYGRSNSEMFVRDDLDANATNKRSVYVGWIYQPNDDDPYEGMWNDVVVFGDAYVGFMRAAEIDALGDSWHLAHLDFPTAWGQAPDGFVYVTSYPAEPPDEVGSGGPPSPLYRIELDDTPVQSPEADD